MNIKHKLNGGLLTISPEGEIDHHGAMAAMGEIKQLISDILPPRIRLDLASVSFMDSSGIAVVMGAFKGAREIGSGFELAGVRPQPLKVLKAAGIDKMISFI